MPKIFVAYSSSPSQIGDTIEAAKRQSLTDRTNLTIQTWRRPDLAGFELFEPIAKAISQSDLVAADITTLNFNVTYEIGYALGLGKRVLPIVNTNFTFDVPSSQRIGIYDNLLREQYADADRLLEIFSAAAVGATYCHSLSP